MKKRTVAISLVLCMLMSSLAYAASVTVKKDDTLVGEAITLNFKTGFKVTLDGTEVDVSPPTAHKIVYGSGTLSGGTLAVTFPDAFSQTAGVIVQCQDTTDGSAIYPSSVTATGFTANGTGSNTFNYVAHGPVD